MPVKVKNNTKRKLESLKDLFKDLKVKGVNLEEPKNNSVTGYKKVFYNINARVFRNKTGVIDIEIKDSKSAVRKAVKKDPNRLSPKEIRSSHYGVGNLQKGVI